MQAIENTKTSLLTDISNNSSPLQTRKRLLILLGLLLAICSIMAFAYWRLVSAKHVTTDDAYTAADSAQIASSINGIVKTIHVIDTQQVKAGDKLVTFDNVDATFALQQAEANVTRCKNDQERTQNNLLRRKKLATTGFLSAEELSHAESAFKEAQTNLQSAMISLEQARVDLQRTVVYAPIDGIVAKRQVQLGQRITAGTPLLSIIPIADIYVNANFKEVQLRHVKIGQQVVVRSDLYGSAVVYPGRVVGISGGTGSSFSIIPAQNATGNWIKVVQRLPVRIALDPKMLIQHPLQVGLSMRADIYIGR